MTCEMEPLKEFTYVRTYANWLEESRRRERYWESVERYIDFIRDPRIPEKVLRKSKEYMLDLAVLPSMRFLWSAGPAAEKDNTCIYNCAFAAIDSVQAFSECLFILMCGTGYGFSVEDRHISKLPKVPAIRGKSGEYVVEDSREGWANSVLALMNALWAGQDLKIIYSDLRPEGERLRTMGGRASGPAPLLTLHNFIRETFSGAQDRKLYDLECHDILCQTGEIVEMGGVRRSSEISLSDLNSERMANAKQPPFPTRRGMANNSAVYLEKPSAARFLTEWAMLANSGTGERGIFNLEGARMSAPKRRKADLIQGCNPCGEINLRNRGFCNLSEVVIRPDDDLDDLLHKVETATWMGAIQSTYVKFPYIRKQWSRNCKEERLLGVSLTGQFDNPTLMSDPTVLTALKQKALKVAAHASKKLGIPMSSAVTCGKPSGTASLLANCSSGAGTWHSPYSLRRVRISAMDPLYKLMRDQGMRFVPDIGHREQDWGNNDMCSIYEPGKKWNPSKVRTWVCEFPVKAPRGSVCRNDISALEHFQHYLTIQEYWSEHNQSITINVRPEEWFAVGEAVYKNWDKVNGVSFLPYDGGHYDLAPREEISAGDYKRYMDNFPKIDYAQLSKYETEKSSDGPGNFACTGDRCEL